MNRPTFFISSTIYDFHDLRSSLKYFLEHQGCRVLGSEFNDFTKPLDLHSYEACLKTIEQSDYFVLLIGARRGGWFDEQGRISITQKEYRTAYEFHKKGRLKLLSFVRAGVWDLREHNSALTRHLKELDEIDKEVAAKATAYPSKFATDAQFIIDFINEVARNKETVNAVAGKGALPTGNWLHVFANFSDVIDVIEPLIFNGLLVADAASRKALQLQLLLLLQSIVPKTDGKPVAPIASVERIANNIKITSEKMFESISVSRTDWNTLIALLVCTQGVKLEPQLIESFLGTPLLLQYMPTSSLFAATPSHDALARLVDECRVFEVTRSSVKFSELVAADRQRSSQTVSVPAVLLVPFLGMLFRWANIMSLATALSKAMDGQPFAHPTLLPRSPISDQNQMLADDRPSLEEIRTFVGLQH